jgi:hypothetical protein
MDFSLAVQLRKLNYCKIVLTKIIQLTTEFFLALTVDHDLLLDLSIYLLLFEGCTVFCNDLSMWMGFALWKSFRYGLAPEVNFSQNFRCPL